MLDEDRLRQFGGSKETLASENLTDDDDQGSKRRASPTELAHDRPELESPPVTEYPTRDGGLGRKASVKRMKQESMTSSKE